MLESAEMLESFESYNSLESDDSFIVRPPFLASDSFAGFLVAFGFFSISY